jgi:predicted nucleic acid-binding protein
LIAYFDTSALMKLILDEEGSDIAQEVWELSSRRLASRIVYPEARAGVAAAERSGRIDAEELMTAVANLEGATRSLHLIDVDSEVAERAGDLAELHGLRAADAMHLASMTVVDSPRLLAAVWDKRLAVAASRCGIGVVPAPPNWTDQQAGEDADPLMIG